MNKCVIWLITIIILSSSVLASRIDLTAWLMQDADFVNGTGDKISTTSFNDSDWIKAIVPGTILTTLVANGKYPDPYFGKSILNIPDLAKQKKTYWYRAKFQLPASYDGKKVWLCFDGVNWIGEFFLNGQKIGDVKGAFKRTKINVTDKAIIGENVIAVYITGNKNPGDKYKNKTLGNCDKNGGVLGRDNPTFHASVGWDWIPTIPDRNMGIWQEVYALESGPLVLRFPNVKTKSLSGDFSMADLDFECMLVNVNTTTVSGILKGVITPGNLTFEKTISVNAAETTIVKLNSSNTPALCVKNPRLWWPNGYGEPNLYTCSLKIKTPTGTVSDTMSFRFGIRTVHHTKSTNGQMLVHINGKQVFCRGGNWGMDEGMKKFSISRFKTQIRYHKMANLNLIRNWVGMTDDEVFYDECDENGIMIWDDFWLAHSNNGPPPNDFALWLDIAKDKILRYRSHPSIVVWCCRNETKPPRKLVNGLKLLTQALDSTRIFLSTSGSGIVHSWGPYNIQNLPDYYSSKAVHGFHTEIGMPSVPNIESLRLMMNPEDLWPVSEVWGFHDWCSDAPNPKTWMKEMNRYGAPDNLEDFVAKSQFINYDGHRALWEGAVVNYPKKVQGAIEWMTNPSWPSLVWQLYDYWLDAHATFWGTRCANESQHIILDWNTQSVKIWNGLTTAKLTAEAILYDASAKELWRKSTTINANSQMVTDCFKLDLSNVPEVYFAKLLLGNEKDKLLSRNFYWMTKTYPGSFKNTFSDLANKKQLVQTKGLITRNADSTHVLLNIKHDGSTAPTLMIRIKVSGASSKKRILPFFATNNYISLLPGESEDVNIVYCNDDANGENPLIELEGWNIDSKIETTVLK